MKYIKTFELYSINGLYGHNDGSLTGVPSVNPDLLLKRFPKAPKFELKRNRYGFWNVYKNDVIYPTRIDFQEEEIDNQIRYVKDVLKSQRKIPSQKIIVDKDINGGIVKFDIED